MQCPFLIRCIFLLFFRLPVFHLSALTSLWVDKIIRKENWKVINETMSKQWDSVTLNVRHLQIASFLFFIRLIAVRVFAMTRACSGGHNRRRRRWISLCPQCFNEQGGLSDLGRDHGHNQRLDEPLQRHHWLIAENTLRKAKHTGAAYKCKLNKFSLLSAVWGVVLVLSASPRRVISWKNGKASSTISTSSPSCSASLMHCSCGGTFSIIFPASMLELNVFNMHLSICLSAILFSVAIAYLAFQFNGTIQLASLSTVVGILLVICSWVALQIGCLEYFRMPFERVKAFLTWTVGDDDEDQDNIVPHTNTKIDAGSTERFPLLCNVRNRASLRTPGGVGCH